MFFLRFFRFFVVEFHCFWESLDCDMDDSSENPG